MKLNEPQTCPQCGFELVSKAKHKQPVTLQVVFGASFVVFLIATNRGLNLPKWLIYTWTGGQILVGYFLVKARMLAKLRVWHCNQCRASLP